MGFLLYVHDMILYVRPPIRMFILQNYTKDLYCIDFIWFTL